MGLTVTLSSNTTVATFLEMCQLCSAYRVQQQFSGDTSMLKAISVVKSNHLITGVPINVGNTGTL